MQENQFHKNNFHIRFLRNNFFTFIPTSVITEKIIFSTCLQITDCLIMISIWNFIVDNFDCQYTQNVFSTKIVRIVLKRQECYSWNQMRWIILRQFFSSQTCFVSGICTEHVFSTQLRKDIVFRFETFVTKCSFIPTTLR